MLFVIFKSSYKVAQYGVQLTRRTCPKSFGPVTEYVRTGEMNLVRLTPGSEHFFCEAINEDEVPDDAKEVLIKAYNAQEALHSDKASERNSKLKKACDDAMKALEDFSHKDELTLSEFIAEFFKNIPDEIVKDMKKEGYKAKTSFSESDFSNYKEYDEISCKKFKIIRKKIVTDASVAQACDLEFNKKTTYSTDIESMKLRIKLLEENSKPLSVPWQGKSYIRKEVRAGRPVMAVYNEYEIPFSGILTKEYAKMLAYLFINTDGNMKMYEMTNFNKKTHKKTYSIQ